MRAVGNDRASTAPLPDLPDRPLLPGFFRIVPMGNDSIQVRSAGRVIRLAIPGIGGLGAPLLTAFDGRSTMAELGQRFALDFSVLQQLVGRLYQDGVLVDGAPSEGDSAIGNPAVAEFHDVLGEAAGKARNAIASARVLFAGLGPAARTAARHLAAAGLGTLVLADPDPVTAMDQAIMPGALTDPSQPRALVAAAECRQAAQVAAGGASGITIVTELEAELATVLVRSSPVDLVVVEVDESGVGAESANAVCLAAGVPALFHQLTTLKGVIGPTLRGSSSACYQCCVSRELSHLRYHEEHVAYVRGLRSGEVPGRQAAVLGGCAGIVGGLLSTEAVSLLTGSPRSATVGGVLVADFRTLEVRRETVYAVPGCPACGARLEEVTIGP